MESSRVGPALQPEGLAAAGRMPTLVVRLPNFIGEVVMAVPMLRLLAASGLEVVAFGRPWSRDLLACLPIACDTAASGRDEVRQYRETGAPWGLAVRTSWTTALRMRLAGLKVIGRRGNLRSFLLHRALPRSFDGHRVDEMLDLGRAAVAAIPGSRTPPGHAPSAPDLSPTTDQVREAEARLRGAGVSGPFVACCPTAGHQRASTFKLWPSFPDFMRRLVEEGVEVVVCPARGETEWYGSIPEGVRVLEGVGIGCLAGLLSLAQGMVSNDTGPAHLAAALGVPTLTLFGDTDPKRYAQRGPRATHLGALGAWPSLEEGWETWQRLVDHGR